jgi:prolyl oligopeptidase
LLAGVALTQRPDLFAAVLSQVPLLDMLRYHKYSGAYLWVAEFGSADIASQFQYLYKYSPLHNIPKNQALPAVLINTGLNDTRVVPSHSFKFAATLQTAQTIDKPILLRVEKEGGHTYSILPREKQIEIATDKISFAWNNVGK